MRFWTNARNALKGAVCLAFMLFASGSSAWAQEEEPKGIDSGDYNIKQSAEFGYRFTNFTGNQNVYHTFVNLDQGPRLLDYTLEVRSLNHQGWVFDRLYFTNFGYGGDPNNVSRLRAYKNKWYNFSATFRRDRNVWDYSLLANPLNPLNNPPPPGGFTITPVGFNPLISTSPHRFDTTRRMSDYNLILRPQDKARFRLGYSRNISEGPSFSSFHEGTDALLFQDWKTTVNAYQLGVDFRFIPRTNISYDQFWRYYKGDTDYTDGNLFYQLGIGAGGIVIGANGQPVTVDLGLPFNAAGNQPCGGTSGPFPFVNVLPSGTAANPLCNGYLDYTRNARMRTSFPTEQLSFQSNYWKKIDLSGRVIYSAGDMNTPDFIEVFGGRVSRTSVRNLTETGPASGQRVSASADAGATWHVTDKFRLEDTFRFSNFRIPTLWSFSFCNFFGPSMAAPSTIFTPTAAVPASCAAPAGGVAGATAPHNGSSPADVAVGSSGIFLKQDLKSNLFELVYDFTSRFGARLGYRFRRRTIDHFLTDSGTYVFYPTLPNTRALPAPFATSTCPAANNRGDGSCLISMGPDTEGDVTEINEHSGLFGFWVRPIDKWRINFDMELMGADNSFTRISPRQLQQYRLRSTYKPVNWISVAASFNILENRDNVPQIDNLQHNRSYGANLVLEPNDKFSFDVGYDYNDVFSQIEICYTATPSPPGPFTKCQVANTLTEALSTYTSKIHFGYFNLMWRPMRRLGAHVGYALTSTTGTALLINPNAPPGTLDYNWHKPYAGIDFHIAKGLTWKTDWGYYGYNEKESTVPIDLFAPRDFRGNMVTLALRYAF